MTAALHEVKARFSEYVTMAENDEDVIITKHGNPYVVMISLKKYKELHTAHRPDFMSELKKWREKNKDLLSNEYSESLEELRKEENRQIEEDEKKRGNIWNS